VSARLRTGGGLDLPGMPAHGGNGTSHMMTDDDNATIAAAICDRLLRNDNGGTDR